MILTKTKDNAIGMEKYKKWQSELLYYTQRHSADAEDTQPQAILVIDKTHEKIIFWFPLCDQTLDAIFMGYSVLNFLK